MSVTYSLPITNINVAELLVKITFPPLSLPSCGYTYSMHSNQNPKVYNPGDTSVRHES